MTPLEGYRVVSLAEQYRGPFARLLLSDLGADVVQVERPAGGDPARAFPWHFAALGRGKSSVVLDLKTDAGRTACRTLVDRADVLLEGFRPGVLARLGLDPAELTATNPGLVDTGTPAMPGLALADVAAGLFATVAALTGLAGRATSGRGGHYDVAMLDALMAFAATRLVPAANGTPPDTLGQDPGYGLFATADGRHAALRGPAEVLDDPQLAAHGLLQQVDGRAFLRQPLTVDGRGPGPTRGVPGLGEHTEEVLRQAGVAPDTLASVLASLPARRY